jgi:hypothetical protein
MSAYIYGAVKTRTKPRTVITDGSVSASGIVISNIGGGFYTLVEPGTYELTASAPGMVSRTYSATVAVGQTLKHDFHLA